MLEIEFKEIQYDEKFFNESKNFPFEIIIYNAMWIKIEPIMEKLNHIGEKHTDWRCSRCKIISREHPIPRLKYVIKCRFSKKENALRFRMML
jgi:hypothetical protein